jgi:D-alanine-D-alanine ligase
MNQPINRPMTQLRNQLVPGPILVLAGGLSHERDVSLRSGRRVAEALRGVGHEVIERDVDCDLIQWISEHRPECVIPMLHGENGEDGTLREVLELLQLPYLGTRPAACRTAFDKPVAKALVRQAGIATPDSVTLPHEAFRELGADRVLQAVVAQMGFPLIVKPTKGGSALGCAAADSLDSLRAAMVNAYSYGQVALIEQFVSGVEIAAPIIAGLPQPGVPLVEIRPDGGVYDYTARYTAGATEFVVPASLSCKTTEDCRRVAELVHQTLGLRDFSRSDLIVDDEGKVWFLEVNVAPGMTETSLVPLSLHAGGHDLGEVFSAIVATIGERI